MAASGIGYTEDLSSHPLPNLHHINFDPGVEACKLQQYQEETLVNEFVASGKKPRACDDGFLEALLRDFAIAAQLHCKQNLARSSYYTLPLPDDSGIKERLREIMQQCRRLKAAPELFSSTIVKSNFLDKISRLSHEMSRTQEVAVQITGFDKSVLIPYRSCLDLTFNPEYIKQHPDCMLPPFFPDKIDRKMPWNKWLDNSAAPKEGWIAIQQKLPRTAEKLLRQITMMYIATTVEFQMVCVTTQFAP